jgi:hypothetical protein
MVADTEEAVVKCAFMNWSSSALAYQSSTTVRTFNGTTRSSVVPRLLIVPTRNSLTFCSKQFQKVPGTARSPNRFLPVIGEHIMKKVSYVLAALATIAVAAPTVASAESFGFRVGSDRDYRDRDYRNSRAEFYGGMHRGWYRNGYNGNH